MLGEWNEHFWKSACLYNMYVLIPGGGPCKRSEFKVRKLTPPCVILFLGVIRCRQEGQWVEEAPYEVMGIIVREHSLVTEAPRKGRENAMLQVQVH